MGRLLKFKLLMLKSMRLDRKTSPPCATAPTGIPNHAGRGLALTRLGPPALRAGAFLFGHRQGSVCYAPSVELVRGLSNVLDAVRYHRYSHSSESCSDRFICARNIAQSAKRGIAVGQLLRATGLDTGAGGEDTG